MRSPPASRRSASFRRRIFCGVAFAAFLAVQFVPPEYFFDKPQAAATRAELSLMKGILNRNAMEAIWTFDDPGARGFFSETKYLRLRPRDDPDAISMRDVAPGTETVPGKFGMARRFPGRDDSFVKSAHHWKTMPEDFSVALWAKVKPMPARQDIFATVDSGTWGFRIDSGKLYFDITTEDGVESISCPYTAFDRYAHLAAVVSTHNRMLALYIDGAEVSRVCIGKLSPKHWPFSFGINSRYRVREPFCGDLDEVGVWNRALDEDEIRRLATAGSGLVKTLSKPHHRARLVATKFAAAALGAVGRLAIPVPSLAHRDSCDKPERFALVMAKPDVRRLAKAHQKATRSGNLTRKSAIEVPAHLSTSGEIIPVFVSIFGRTDFHPGGERPALSIRPREEGRTFPGGESRIVLSPPETSGWTLPLAESMIAEETRLPIAPKCRLARFLVNGREKGLYLMRDFSCGGTAKATKFDPMELFGPIQSARVAWSGENLVTPTSLSEASKEALCAFFDEKRLKTLEKRIDGANALLAGDIRSPLPNRCRRHRLASVKRMVQYAANEKPFPDALSSALRESLFLGRNESGYRVVENLDFETFSSNLPTGFTAKFHSARPDIVSDAGKILSRPERAPVAVDIDAEITGRNATIRKSLRFRVMPECIRIGSVFVWAGSLFDRTYRSDAVVSRFNPGPARPAPDATMPATLAGGGGVRYRGNSSFVKMNRKKLLNVETDVPHGFFGHGDTRKALQIDAQSDRLMLFNSLAYHVFRKAPRSDGQTNVAPEISRTELFVNGRYTGLCEWAQRIDNDLVGSPDTVFFRHAVARPRIPQTRQIRPALKDCDFESEYRELCDDFKAPAKPGWIEKISSKLDLNNVADYQLLINLFQNTNVGDGSFMFMEYLALDLRKNLFYHVPWDFDIALPNTGMWLSSESNRLLERNDPDYMHRLARRWWQWRREEVSDEKITAKFLDLFDEIDGYLGFEIELYENPPDPEAWIENLKRTMLSRLRRQIAVMDKMFDPESGKIEER